jgi:hypothetical protein
MLKQISILSCAFIWKKDLLVDEKQALTGLGKYHTSLAQPDHNRPGAVRAQYPQVGKSRFICVAWLALQPDLAFAVSTTPG